MSPIFWLFSSDVQPVKLFALQSVFMIILLNKIYYYTVDLNDITAVRSDNKHNIIMRWCGCYYSQLLLQLSFLVLLV